MNQNNIPNPFTEEPAYQRTAKLRRSLAVYLRKWPIFLLSILFFLFLAWLYTRYLTPIYQSNIKVLIKDSQKGAGANVLLSDVAVQGGMNGGIENEIEIMKSRRLIQKVIDNLDLSNEYIKVGKVIDTEIYINELPILLKSLVPDTAIKPTQFKVDFDLPNINVTHNEKVLKTAINKPFKINNQSFVFYSNPLNNSKTGDFLVKVLRKDDLAKNLQNRIVVEMSNNYASVLQVKLNSSNTSKSEDIITELVRVYNVDAKNDKSLEFEKTGEFIEERIAILNNELSGVEGQKEDFQQGNDIANLEAEIGSSIGKKNQVESELLELDTQISLVDTYKNYVDSQPISEVLPSDITNSGGGTNSAVNTYNQLVTERNNMIANGATSDHPMVQNLEQNISSAKSNILTNITKQQQVLRGTRDNLSSQLSSASGFKRKAPRLERISRDIDRQQQIKESLYLLLLEKREEAAISGAITEDKIKIIDPASSVGPVSPIKSRYYFGALALGLLIPLAGIYTKELLKNKIEAREDLEDLVGSHAIVGEIPRATNMIDKFDTVSNDLGPLSEAFRIMRTNVAFIAKKSKQDKKGIVTLVTSSVKGEGKTFISMNYAHTLGHVRNKKTILIGSDIRNPQLHRYEDINKNIDGLTEYLYNNEVLDHHQFIHPSKSNPDMHIMFSGSIPPNPTEILMSERFGDLIEKLRLEYDYIVIDSAPLVLVSDTYHISHYADLTLYVTRSEYTPKNVLQVPLEAEQNNRLKKLCFVINDISSSQSGYAYGYKYNYGYGYGYGQNAKKNSYFDMFSKLFKRK
ncbi:polysaccharide biosynthesis tyrosine autokinase [Flavobacteriaceae bacterium Ap0902]|nr:polysaccharide biosynthesis tyrosine autokinase [Flavobacteriaceae bacterium Ap0902]